MAVPSFSKSGMTTLVFSRGPAFPHTAEPVLQQTVLRSYAGTRRTATFQHWRPHPLQWPQLPEADVALVRAWFADSRINYSAEDFTYTDPAGIQHTVYLEPRSLEITPIAHQLYRVSLILHEELA